MIVVHIPDLDKDEIYLKSLVYSPYSRPTCKKARQTLFLPSFETFAFMKPMFAYSRANEFFLTPIQNIDYQCGYNNEIIEFREQKFTETTWSKAYQPKMGEAKLFTGSSQSVYGKEMSLLVTPMAYITVSYACEGHKEFEQKSFGFTRKEMKVEAV